MKNKMKKEQEGKEEAAEIQMSVLIHIIFEVNICLFEYIRHDQNILHFNHQQKKNEKQK